MLQIYDKYNFMIALNALYARFPAMIVINENDGLSKLRANFFRVNSFNWPIILDFFSQIIVDSGYRFHYASTIVLQLFDRLRKALSDSIDWLHCLDWVYRSTIFKNVQFLEFRDIAHHMLSYCIFTLISPIELAMPAPYPKCLLSSLQTPNSKVNQ